MTVRIFLAVIYLGLTFTNLAKGQYQFGDGSRNMFNPQSQRPFSPPPQNFAPGYQSTGFNHNPQETNHQNVGQVPNFNPFIPPTFPLFPDFSTLFHQGSSSFPPQMNQPTPQNPVPHNPYNPQIPNSNFPYPQQNNAFNPASQSPGGMFNNQQQANSFNPYAQSPGGMFNNHQNANPFSTNAQGPGGMFNNHQRPNSFNPSSHGPGGMFNNHQPANPFNPSPQQPSSLNHPPTSLLSTPIDIDTTALRLLEQAIKPGFTDSQQNSPSYISPQKNVPAFPNRQQTRPFNPRPVSPVFTPTDIFSPGTLMNQAINPASIPPKQTNPSYTKPQETVPSSPGLLQTNSDFTTPQQPYQDPTGSQQSNSEPAIPQQTTPDSANPQQSETDSTILQTPVSDSVVHQPVDTQSTQQPSSDSTISQMPASDSAVQPSDSKSTISQQPASDSAITQLATSDSTVPEQTDSEQTVPPQTTSNSTVSQQPDSESVVAEKPASDSKVSQQPYSGSIGPQKTVADSDNVQPITSASESSSSVSSPPQGSGSVSNVPQQPVHIPHSRNSTTQYIPRSEKQRIHRDPLRDLRIVCIFNNKHFYRNGFNPAKLEAHLCTHLNYEFAVLDPKTHEMMVGDPDLDMDMKFFQEAIDLKKINNQLKVILSLGGWGDSTEKYSILASDPAKRANFVDKAVEFLLKHEFDGLDLAWEYPNCWQGAIGISPKDKPNFVALLKDIKAGFAGHGLILSISVGAIKREVDAAYDVPEIVAVVDYINVMTYDMHGPWESVTGHHVQFEGKPGDKDPYCNVKGGIQVWVEKGAPRKKLNMGLALYGRTFTLQNPNQCGMGVPAAGPGNPGPVTKEGGIMNYHEICNFLNSGKWVEKEDPKAGFYACSDDGQWACYDPPAMMVRKVKYVVLSGMGGVLLKDLSGDDCDGDCFNMPFPCLKMIKLEMVHRARHKNQ